MWTARSWHQCPKSCLVLAGASFSHNSEVPEMLSMWFPTQNKEESEIKWEEAHKAPLSSWSHPCLRHQVEEASDSQDCHTPCKDRQHFHSGFVTTLEQNTRLPRQISNTPARQLNGSRPLSPLLFYQTGKDPLTIKVKFDAVIFSKLLDAVIFSKLLCLYHSLSTDFFRILRWWDSAFMIGNKSRCLLPRAREEKYPRSNSRLVHKGLVEEMCFSCLPFSFMLNVFPKYKKLEKRHQEQPPPGGEKPGPFQQK